MASLGKIIIVAALDGTFQRKPFLHILELVPLAESVTKLTAVCTICGQDASFTKRITTEEAIEVIGGADKYIATCRTCFHKPTDTDLHQALEQFMLVRESTLTPSKSRPSTATPKSLGSQQSDSSLLASPSKKARTQEILSDLSAFEKNAVSSPTPCLTLEHEE